MSALRLIRVSGLITVQDMGRPGQRARGLSRGGAMDRHALLEAAALLGAPAPLAGLEMAGAGGVFEVTVPGRIALTGAPMAARLDGRALAWPGSHRLEPGQRLEIGAALAGTYGYLVPAGGITTAPWLGSRAAHLAIGIGAPLGAGTLLPIGADPAPDTPPLTLPAAPPAEARFAGGQIRMMDGPQTALFDPETLDAFYATEFRVSPRANRQGIALKAPRRFSSPRAAGLASDLIGPGEVQATGDGLPFVLMAECQTMGGYPRIGTVIPADLPRVAQAPAGTSLRFVRLSLEAAVAACPPETVTLRALRALTRPLIRDPATIPDLLSYRLIDGAISAHHPEE